MPVCPAAGAVARYAARPPAELPSLGRGYQFQKLLRVVQHLAEMILLVAQCRCSKLRRHAGILQTRIRGHEANLIHTDASCVRQRSFQLFGQFSGFGFPGGEREGKTRELVLGNARRKSSLRNCSRWRDWPASSSIPAIAAAEGRKSGGGTGRVTSDGTGSGTNGDGTGNRTGVAPSANGS